MTGEQVDRSSLLSRYGDLALFLFGVLLAAAGILVSYEAPVTAAVVVIGAGLSVVAVLLPRLTGVIRISPGSIELNVLERLQATREEAQLRVPEQVTEAIRLAILKLAADDITSSEPPLSGSDKERAPSTPRRRVAALLGSVLVVATLTGALVWSVHRRPGGFVSDACGCYAPIWQVDRLTLAITAVTLLTILAAGWFVLKRSRTVRHADSAGDDAGASPRAFARSVISQLGAPPVEKP